MFSRSHWKLHLPHMALTWWVLCLLIAFKVTCESTTCPSSCYCDEGGEYVSCVGDGIWQLPADIPTTTVRLELRNYLITALSAQDTQGLTELKELKLQQSRVETIENSTFAGNQKLQRLDLSQNSLTMVSSAVFQGLEKLRFLDLSSNLIQSIDEAFVELPNLEQLNMRDNRIPQLTTRTFVGLHKVQYLNLDANNISSVEVGTFQYLTNLAHLIVSNNPLTSLSRLDFFGSRLQFIDISHVGLDRVPQSLTKFVRDLRLAKNNLTRISAGDFDSYPYLGLLVLDDNCVSEIENDALGRQEYLMRLWLNGNCLTKVPPNLPPSLLALYMEENKLTDLPSYSFKGLIHLEQLFLQRNNIHSLTTCAFCDLLSLKSLDLQANQIENLTGGVFANLTELETLDLSQNKLKILDSRCFDGLSRLKTIQMSRVPTLVQLDEAMFDPLQSLQTLEVYDSSLLVHKIINSTRMLHGLRKVQELNIMHNKIVRLRSDFPSFLPGLKIIKMSGNLWHCDREITWLSTWIKQSNVQFYSSYSIRCATPENLQFKPLMMLNDNDFIDTTTAGLTSTTKHSIVSTSTTERNYERLSSPTYFLNPPATSTFNNSSELFKTTAARTESASQNVTSTDVELTPESSTEPKFMSAYPYRYNIIRETEKPDPVTVPSNLGSTIVSNDTNASQSSTDDSSEKLVNDNTAVVTSNFTTDKQFTSLMEESTSTTTYPSGTVTASTSSASEPVPTKNLLTTRIVLKTKVQTVAPQRRVLSSRLRGWTNVDPTTSPTRWDHTTTIVVSVVLAAGGFLAVVGVVTLFTLVRCRHRYQPVKHRHMRRSSSISYYPQKDEVSIVTLTEGTVGLRTNSHHGLGNKLYYIMENGGNSADPTRDALPDPQLQELLPQTPPDSANLY